MDGPTRIRLEVLVCNGCPRLIRNKIAGREETFFCHHPAVWGPMRTSRMIGKTSNTPPWCPISPQES